MLDAAATLALYTTVSDIAVFFQQRQLVSFDLPECQIPYTVVPNFVRRASIENVVHTRLYQRHGRLYVCSANAFCFGAGALTGPAVRAQTIAVYFFFSITTARETHVLHARWRRKRGRGRGRGRGTESTVLDTRVVRDSLDEMKSSRSVRLGRCACAAGDTAEHKL